MEILYFMDSITKIASWQSNRINASKHTKSSLLLSKRKAWEKKMKKLQEALKISLYLLEFTKK